MVLVSHIIVSHLVSQPLPKISSFDKNRNYSQGIAVKTDHYI